MKKYPMGFMSEMDNNKYSDNIRVNINSPKRSVVRVHFPVRNMTLSYYNDMFDLKKGDIVYVEGKLEGLQGRVVDVSYTFKIKLSDYKRVIAVADVDVSGELYFAGSHMLAFDRQAIPFEKVITWFCAPMPDDDYAVGSGNDAFPLDDLGQMSISCDIAERGKEYYMGIRVCYICVDGTNGKAIVEGSENYIVEFTYADGEISDLVCSCFCSYTCKHEFAAMLQLKECLDIIAEEYGDKSYGYFAAVSKETFMNVVFNNKKLGKININV